MILSSCPWEQQSPSPFDDKREEILDTYHVPTSSLFDSDDDNDDDDIIYDSQPSPKVPSSPLPLQQQPSQASVYHTCPDSQPFAVPPPPHLSLPQLPNSDSTMAEINSNAFVNNAEDPPQSPLHIPSSLMETFLPPDDYSDHRQYCLPSTMPELPSMLNNGWSTQDDDDEEL